MLLAAADIWRYIMALCLSVESSDLLSCTDHQKGDDRTNLPLRALFRPDRTKGVPRFHAHVPAPFFVQNRKIMPAPQNPRSSTSPHCWCSRASLGVCLCFRGRRPRHRHRRRRGKPGWIEIFRGQGYC